MKNKIWNFYKQLTQKTYPMTATSASIPPSHPSIVQTQHKLKTLNSYNPLVKHNFHNQVVEPNLTRYPRSTAPFNHLLRQFTNNVIVGGTSNNPISVELISKILKRGEEYRRTKEPDKRILLEIYGFALGLCHHIDNLNAKQNIEKTILDEIKRFLFDDLRLKRDIEISNLTSNFNDFKAKLESIRLQFNLKDLSQSTVATQKSFEELIHGIFDYLHGMLGEPPSNTQYVLLSVGSLATQMTTPYSDIEYIALVDKNTDENRIYFSNFADLFELMMIGFGESPIYKAEDTLNEFKSYFKDIKKGTRVDEHKRPQDNNRLFGLITTPQELLKALPNKIIHEPGNHITTALLTTGFLEGNREFYDRYQQLYIEVLSSGEYYKCLKSLLKECYRACDGFQTKLHTDFLKSDFEKTIDVKEILVHGIHLARQLAIFLRCCGEKIELKSNFFEIIEELKTKNYINQEQYQRWRELVNLLFSLRLELQAKTQSANAKISLKELQEKCDILSLCHKLKEIADITKAHIAKRSNPQFTEGVEIIIKKNLGNSAYQDILTNDKNIISPILKVSSEKNSTPENLGASSNTSGNKSGWGPREKIALASFTVAASGFLYKIYQDRKIQEEGKKQNFIDNRDIIPEFANAISRYKLTELKDKLKQIKNNIVYIAITGFPGTGKTVLAQDYVREYLQEKEKNPNYQRTCWYFRSEKESTLKEDYKSFAKILDIQFNTDTKIEDIINMVQDKLSKRKDFILLFDNVKDYEDIAQYLPEHPALTGQVVITSRNKDILPDDKNTNNLSIPLNEGLKKKESLELLRKFSGLTDDAGAKLLAIRLGGLPLALVQAANYIKKKHLTYEDYLKTYDKEYKTLLSKEKLPWTYDKILNNPNDQEKGMLTTYDAVLRLSFNTLSPEAQEILYLSAYVNPDSIPEQLFSTLDINPAQLSLVLSELEKCSLINRGTNNFSVHRIIQDIAKLRVQERHLIENFEQICINKALDLIHKQHRIGIDIEHDFYNKRFLIPHLEALLFNINQSEHLTEVIIQGYLDLALLYKATGKAAKAVTFYERLLPLVESNENVLSAEVYKGLGRAYQGSGQFNKAETCYKKAHRIYLNLYTEPNTELAEILNDLGMVSRDLGDELQKKSDNRSKAYFNDAFNFLDNAVKMAKSLPTQNKNSVRYMTNLGEAYRKLKDLDNAVSTIQKAISIGQKEFPDEKNRLMASAYFTLGNTYTDKGEYQQAKLCFEKAINIGSDETVCGKNHPMVARHTDALGMAYRNMGDEEKACQHFTKANEILEHSKLGMKQLRDQVSAHLDSCGPQKDIEFTKNVAKFKK